jgi:glycosyltransferase involved in cell wall biosynthesis
MRILIDGRLYGLENAGLGRYVINLVEYLQKEDRRSEYYILLRGKYFDDLKLAGNWKKVLADFRHYTVAEQLKLPEIISKINPDLTHFLHFNVPVFWKGKFVVTIHDMLMHKYVGLSATTLPAPIYWLKRFAYKEIFKYAVLKSSKILVPSEAVKEEVVDYYKIVSEKVAVTYEGVDKEIGLKDCRELLKKHGIDSKYVVYAGNTHPHKNLDRLVEAVVLLNNNIDRKVFLVIASSRNIFTQKLEELVKKLNAGEYIKLLGFVPDEILGSLYKNSHAFVAASLSEGFGLPGLEAMQSGTLVLASEIPVFREIYKDAATYFNPLDFTSIEKTIRMSLEMGKEEREERIEKGKVLAGKFSWDKMAKETLKVYAEIKNRNSLRSG